MLNSTPSAEERVRSLILHSLTRIEDVVYAGLGILLGAAALWLLFTTMLSFGQSILARAMGPSQMVGLLDQLLLVLLIVELLYTVQVSFREHSLVAEPFLVVALIATIRKILVLTAQLPQMPEQANGPFQHMVIELLVLSGMVIVYVGSLILLQRHARQAADRKAGKAPANPPN